MCFVTMLISLSYKKILTAWSWIYTYIIKFRSYQPKVVGSFCLSWWRGIIQNLIILKKDEKKPALTLHIKTVVFGYCVSTLNFNKNHLTNFNETEHESSLGRAFEFVWMKNFKYTHISNSVFCFFKSKWQVRNVEM